MLELKNISKIYQTEGFAQRALDNVSISFRDRGLFLYLLNLV